MGQRLLVLSDAACLVDAQARLRPWVARARFKRWRERVIFTPTQTRFWGAREVAVEQPEGAADPGFLVLPLDESALDAWSLLLVTGKLSGFTLSEPERYPSLLADGAADVFGDHPLAQAELESLIEQLKLYLGDTGFRWLAALAVPPLWRWDLTLLIGHSLVEIQSALAPATDTSRERGRRSVLVSLNYRRLTQLPWFRERVLPDGSTGEAWMPEWLRLRLLHELPPAAAEQVREAVRTALSWATAGAGSTGIPLRLELPPGDVSRSPTASEPPESGNVDSLYLGYMTGLSAEQLALRAPAWPWLKSLQLPVRTRGFRAGLRRIGQFAGALWARLAFRDGVAAAGLTSRSGLAAGLWLVLWAFAVFFVAGTKPGDPPPPEWNRPLFRRVLENAFVTQTHAAGLANVPLKELRFGADGKRLHVMAEDGTGRVLDTASGRELTRWRGPKYIVRQAAFSDDALRVATRSDEAADVWDAATGTRLLGMVIGERGGLPASHSAIHTFALSGDGLQLAVGTTLGTIIWEVKTGARMPTTAGFAAPFCLKFDARGERLAAATMNGVVVLELATNRTLARLNWSPSSSFARRVGLNVLEFLPDSRLAVGLNSNITTLTLPSAERSIPNLASLSEVASSSNGERVAAVTALAEVGVWETTAPDIRDIGRVAATNTSGTHGAIALSSNGSRLALLTSDGVELWDPEAATDAAGRRRAASRVTKLDAEFPHIVRFSLDGTQLAIADYGPTLRLWRTRTGSVSGFASSTLDDAPEADTPDTAPVSVDLAQDWRRFAASIVTDEPWSLSIGFGVLMILFWTGDQLWLRRLARKSRG